MHVRPGKYTEVMKLRVRLGACKIDLGLYYLSFQLRRYFYGGSYCFMSWCLSFCAVCALCVFSYFKLSLGN